MLCGHWAYCDSEGQIRFVRQDGTLTPLIDCKHGQEAEAYIQWVEEKYSYSFFEGEKPAQSKPVHFTLTQFKSSHTKKPV